MGTTKMGPTHASVERRRLQMLSIGESTHMSRRSTVFWVTLALAVGIVLVFAPVWQFDFVALDDPLYVSENPQVAGGLTWAGVKWAFTTTHGGFWIPLVWLSYMADVGLFGPAAGPHHAVNLLLHVANTLLLFGALRRMTGAAGRSAFVAALFAVHPLHVESVAWITERKDVLSTLFLVLALLAYAGHVRRPGWPRYLAVAGCFALGLMAKPMIVTLPALLLLLDVWPLKRRTAWSLVLEKLPLVALAVAAGVITFLAQRHAGAVGGLEAIPLGLRLGNAAASYAAYIRKAIWPAGLAAFYPLSASIPAWKVTGTALLLAAVSAAVIRAVKPAPYLAAGWFWYLVTLLPVIGLVQAGLQASADRFTYMPLNGLFIMAAWGMPALVARSPWRSLARGPALPVIASVIVVSYGAAAHVQLRYWSDSVAMWTRVLEVTFGVDSYRAHMTLGSILEKQQRLGEAASHYAAAVQLVPGSAEARRGLGLALGRQGKLDDAVASLSEAVRLGPEVAGAHSDLAFGLSQQGRTGEAIAQVTLRPSGSSPTRRRSTTISGCCSASGAG